MVGEGERQMWKKLQSKIQSSALAVPGRTLVMFQGLDFKESVVGNQKAIQTGDEYFYVNTLVVLIALQTPRYLNEMLIDSEYKHNNDNIPNQPACQLELEQTFMK